MSAGTRSVRAEFNPTKNPYVAEIKDAGAALLDLIDSVHRDERCASIAKTNIEQGVMWAVKSVTK